MDLARKKLAVFKEKIFLRSFVLSAIFLAIGLFATYLSGIYANKKASNAVEDIFLSNVPVADVDFLFIYGPLLFWTFILIISIKYIHRLPFVLNSIALFTIVRSVFVSLTHLGPVATRAIAESDNLISRFSTSNDFFFSGHTGAPFLMALLFWDIKPVRYVCLAASVFFGAIVLLGHYHYSIDVLSAFFITYTIYKISEFIFKKEKEFFAEIEK